MRIGRPKPKPRTAPCAPTAHVWRKGEWPSQMRCEVCRRTARLALTLAQRAFD